MASGELARRVGVAAVGIPLAILLIWLGGWPLGIVLALLAALGATELFTMAEAVGIRPYRPLGAALAAALVVFAVGRAGYADAAPAQLAAIITAALAACIGGVWLRSATGRPIEAAAVTVFAAVYAGGGLAFAMLLRNLDPGPFSWTGAAFVAYPLTVTWIGDSVAYFGGRTWGRRKLIPSVSPNKTVVGAVAGFVGSVMAGVLFGWLILDTWLGTGIGAVTGGIGAALIAPVAQVGDLAESLFKRQAGLKDSGQLFPGHGGMLDRFDAVIVALPVAYLYIAAVLSYIADSP